MGTTALTGDAQRRDPKPPQSQAQVQIAMGSTQLTEEHVTSGRDVENRDERNGSSVKERAERSEGAMTKEDDVPKEQETSKNAGDGRAQRIMVDLNKARGTAEKIAEYQKTLKKKGSNISKHMEEQLENRSAEIGRLRRDLSENDKEIRRLQASLEMLQQEAEKSLQKQRALEEQLENRKAEIDCLQKDLAKKVEEIPRRQASVERLQQEAAKTSPGFFPNAQGLFFEKPVMADVQGDFHFYANGEKRVLDKLPIARDGMYESISFLNSSLCHPGTRETVLKTITDWVDNSDPDKRILWVNGLGGTGKSTVAQTIIKGYKDSRIAATFFFLKGHAVCGHADHLFTTLAWQMAKSIPETRPHIESVLNTQHRIHTKDLDVQFDRLFVEVFGRVVDLRPEKSLIVIDGIDELSSERQQTHLLRLIGDKLASPGIPLRFIIFGRPEPHIKEIFDMENMSKITHPLSLDEYEPKEDIRKYLTEKFHEMFTKPGAAWTPKDEDIDSLVSKSPRQFIFASTVVSFIGDDRFPPQEQLRFLQQLRVIEEKPFALMDQLYIQILSQQKDRKDTKMLRDLFVLLIALGHPTLLFVSRRLGIKEKQLRSKLRAMHALVPMTNSRIGAYHRTLHDFFLDKQRSKQYYIHPLRVDMVRLSQKRCVYWRIVSVLH